METDLDLPTRNLRSLCYGLQLPFSPLPFSPLVHLVVHLETMGNLCSLRYLIHYRLLIWLFICLETDFVTYSYSYIPTDLAIADHD